MAREYFAQLVGRLAAADPHLRFLVLGSGDDVAPARMIADAAPVRTLDLTGRTSLLEMIECVRGCALMVTNDTGPMHVAAALGKPVVALFGPTDPRSTGPYRQLEVVMQNRQLPCVPCMKSTCRYFQPLECLRSLTPEMVFAAVVRRLGEHTHRPVS